MDSKIPSRLYKGWKNNYTEIGLQSKFSQNNTLET